MSTPPIDGAEPNGTITVADMVRARRLELGLSKAEFARYVSPTCQPSDIDILESHRQLMPSWIRMRQLADALEVSVADLLPSEQRHDAERLDVRANPAASYANP